MAKLDTIIRNHKEQIIGSWRDEARRTASARGLTEPEFDNILPEFLSSIAAADSTDIGQFSGRRRELIESHFSHRLRQGFDLAELIDEIAVLGRMVMSICDTVPIAERPDSAEIQRFFTELHRASTTIADMFGEHMARDEQVDKRYARLLQQVASDALAIRSGTFQEVLNDFLKLIMQAMNAQSAALLLFDPCTNTLIREASIGFPSNALKWYRTSSFAAQVASDSERSTLDVRTTELQLSDSLKGKGIRSVLAVRLPSHHKVIGVLYVGMAETRPFSVRELRRIETLADQLTLHLDNVELYRELEEKIDELHHERELREQFVSVLAHDLRGPLNVAKMAATVLMSNPETLDARHELATRIDANIGRLDGMIKDLLDVNSIRANKPLALRLDECDLVELASEVIAELSLIHGQRFILNADNVVRGIWSADELRRTLWNLAINAVKYGSPDTPIAITVTRSDSYAQASVHNFGSVLTGEEQTQLFKPFARTPQAQRSSQTGWGLGLTLVRGCAEAHGGTVTIDSRADAGTTFTLQLPFDSRPYQPGPEE